MKINFQNLKIWKNKLTNNKLKLIVDTLKGAPTGHLYLGGYNE